MIKLFDFIIVAGFALICWSLATNDPKEIKRYPSDVELSNVHNWVFKYEYKGKKISISKSGKDEGEAMKIAGRECYASFSQSQKKFNENVSMEIIDVCANPNSKLQKSWYQ